MILALVALAGLQPAEAQRRTIGGGLLGAGIGAAVGGLGMRRENRAHGRYDPGRSGLSGGMLGAGIGAAAGGGRGAAIGGAIGGGQAEFMAFVMPRFASADTDKNGLLTAAEVEAFNRAESTR